MARAGSPMRFWAYARARGPISIETDNTAGAICLPKRSTEFNKNGGPGFVSRVGRMGTHLFVAANLQNWMWPDGLEFVPVLRNALVLSYYLVLARFSLIFA